MGNTENSRQYFYPKLQAYRESARIYLSTERRKNFTLDEGSIVYNPMEISRIFNSETYRRYDRKFRKHMVDRKIKRVPGQLGTYVVVEPICSKSLSMLGAFISGEHVDGWDFFEGLDEEWRKKHKY